MDERRVGKVPLIHCKNEWEIGIMKMMMSKRLFAKVALTGVGAALVARAAQALDRAPLKDSVAVPETIDPGKALERLGQGFSGGSEGVAPEGCFP